MGNITRPLDGIIVVELATFVAAPSCCRYLADLGAEVIKVESHAGDPLRYTAVTEGRPSGEKENTSYDLENANKRGICLNLKTEAGIEVFYKLLSKADIFITNLRQKALERIGIDYETLKLKHPSLVYGIVTGYGETGPDKDLPGFDFTAYSARGGVLGPTCDKDSNPMNLIPGFGDHQVGIFLASGVIAALYRARNTGQGDKVSASLFHAAIWDISIMLQSSQYKHESTQWPVSRKEMANPLNVAHKTKDDRWIQIAMPQYDFFYEKFIKLLDRPDLVGDGRFFPAENLQPNLIEFYDIIKEGMAKKTKDEWVKILTDADIPFAVAQNWDELLEDEQAWESGCFYAMKYPTGATRTLVRPPIIFTETEVPEYRRGPYLGENTEIILSELGYESNSIMKMIENNEAKKWSPQN